MRTPMRGAAFKIATVWGIPIRVHLTLVLLFPFLAWRFHLGWWRGVLLTVAVLASIVLHELGHCLVCLRCGCRVRDILLLPIGGAARMERMPTRPSQELLLALAGPAVSIALGLILLFGVARLPGPSFPLVVGDAVVRVPLATLLGYVNLSLALFNLLPAFPMDGGRVLRAALTPRAGRLHATWIASLVGRAMAVAFAGIALFNPAGVFPLFQRAMLVLIGAFIFRAAGAEYRAVRRQELSHSFEWGFWSAEGRGDGGEPRAVVMPPPYRPGPGEEIPVRPAGQRDPDGPFRAP
jgi:Zn-dependent protease